MLTKEQAEAIANSARAHRPDWSIPQLMAVLGDERIRKHRDYRATALAAVILATDGETRQPTRLLSEGAWWNTANPLASVYHFPALEDTCVECGQPSHRHSAPAYADHPWTNRPQPAPKPEETP